MPVTTLDELTRFLRHCVGEGLSRSIKVVISGQGVVRVVGATVSNEDGPADLVITLTAETLRALGERKLDPFTAIRTGGIHASNKLAALSMIPQVLAKLARKPQG